MSVIFGYIIAPLLWVVCRRENVTAYIKIVATFESNLSQSILTSVLSQLSTLYAAYNFNLYRVGSKAGGASVIVERK